MHSSLDHLPVETRCCIRRLIDVCGMKLGDMGKPYVFVRKGREIKVCDKSEEAVFDKDPDKYMKKMADAQAKLKK